MLVQRGNWIVTSVGSSIYVLADWTSADDFNAGGKLTRTALAHAELVRTGEVFTVYKNKTGETAEHLLAWVLAVAMSELDA